MGRQGSSVSDWLWFGYPVVLSFSPFVLGTSLAFFVESQGLREHSHGHNFRSVQPFFHSRLLIGCITIASKLVVLHLGEWVVTNRIEKEGKSSPYHAGSEPTTSWLKSWAWPLCRNSCPKFRVVVILWPPPGPTKVLAANRGKWLMGKMQNPLRKTIPKQEYMSWEGQGIKIIPSAGKIFFSLEISMKLHFYTHLAA